MSVDYSRFLSRRTAHWQRSSIRGLFELETPTAISFLAGKPSPEMFPFQAITIDLTGGDTLRLDGADLVEGLQYTSTTGLPRLLAWFNELSLREHGRGVDGKHFACHVGPGSSDLLGKLLLALTDPGDAILIESPAYAFAEGLLRTVTQSGAAEDSLEVLEVATDGQGLIPERLEAVLESRDPSRRRPRVLITNPVGANPTSATCPEDRKRRILQLCAKHDLLLIEDDAYSLIYYGDAPRPRSYWSLEQEELGTGGIGRVIRTDSWSKVVSSGMRIGFAQGPKPIMDLIDGNTNLQPSSLTQAIALKLVQRWGVDGFLEHCQRVAAFYKAKCLEFDRIARKHLGDVADWTTPQAGMFLFIHLRGIEDSYELIRERAVKAGIIAVPGMSFMAQGAKSPALRISFSLASAEQAEIAFPRLRAVVLEAQGKS